MSAPEPLLPRVAAGDHEAVTACLERFGNLVWSLARRFLSNPADAEDAVQEIFIDLWSSASRWDSSKGSETTFVAMLARRRLVDRLRASARRPPTEEITGAAGAQRSGLQPDYAIRDEAARAARLVGTLKPEQRQVIKLAVVEGHTHQSIADALQLPLGTVKTHLRRGLLQVREAMQEAAKGAGRSC